MGVSGVARPQGAQPAAVSNPFGHPTPYAYGTRDKEGKDLKNLDVRKQMDSFLFLSPVFFYLQNI
jgi:hypothetical protein